MHPGSVHSPHGVSTTGLHRLGKDYQCIISSVPSGCINTLISYLPRQDSKWLECVASQVTLLCSHTSACPEVCSPWRCAEDDETELLHSDIPVLAESWVLHSTNNGIFFLSSEWHKWIVNKWSAGLKYERKVSGACYQNLHVNKWLKKYFSCKKVPLCDYLCNIQHNRAWFCLWALENERVSAVHSTVRLRSGSTVSLLNMSRFAMSNSIPWAIHFIFLFSWHNSSFHFILPPLVPFPFHS